jgi:hypothetical protein
MKYDVSREQINIEGYSPFWFVNEVSEKYQRDPFVLPFVQRKGGICPVHPDTFKDLGLRLQSLAGGKFVYPTSSFRTVYDPEENCCYKVPILRRITRGLRNLPHKELWRSEEAKRRLSEVDCENFSYLPEEVHPDENPRFNHIVRSMPDADVFPWFYAIKSQNFDGEFMERVAKNIVSSWLTFASNGLLLEYHTQNILVDGDTNLYYRDLSDVRSMDGVLRPSYADIGLEDMLSTIFDRTVCRQNLDHMFRYDEKLGDGGKARIKEFIGESIRMSGLKFPDYSMDFPKNSPERVPQKTDLTWWRDFTSS